MKTADQLKAALNARAPEFAQWLFPVGRRDGVNWRVGSLAGERGESLGICIAGAKVGIFKDFATGESGDNLLELFAQARRVPFFESLRACTDWLGIFFHASAMNPAPRPAYPPVSLGGGFAVPMTAKEDQCALKMAATVRDNFSLCERVARDRNWHAQTISELAHEPSLGWHDGKLAFLYESGVKLRWHQDGERIIRWAFGRPWLWRGGLLWSHDIVYLCEGETDAITLIDAGLERDGSTIAVAIPSASTFNPEWAQLFAAKHVVLSFDGDGAGRLATKKVSRLLLPVVKTLKQVNWEALQHAS